MADIATWAPEQGRPWGERPEGGPDEGGGLGRRIRRWLAARLRRLRQWLRQRAPGPEVLNVFMVRPKAQPSHAAATKICCTYHDTGML